MIAGVVLTYAPGLTVEYTESELEKIKAIRNDPFRKIEKREESTRNKKQLNTPEQRILAALCADLWRN